MAKVSIKPGKKKKAGARISLSPVAGRPVAGKVKKVVKKNLTKRRPLLKPPPDDLEALRLAHEEKISVKPPSTWGKVNRKMYR